MPDNPFKFWEELKRRKVVRVVIGYLASAYVILELTSIIAEPWGMPGWTINFVSVLLILGFFIVIIFSWIFDVTPSGVKKTGVSGATKSISKTDTKPFKWRFKVSDVIILVLIVLVIFMAYPKVFNKENSLESMTVPVTFINELDEKETSRVFKEEYIHRLMVFPFQSIEIDTNNQWQSYGISEGLVEDLKQFQYLIAYSHNGLEKRPEQISLAKNNNCPYFLTGTYKLDDGEYIICCNLYLTSSGSIIEDITYIGSDLFNILDSISLQTRVSIGVPDEVISGSPDLTLKEHLTEDIEAYSYFILGYIHDQLKMESTLTNYYKAFTIDPSFAVATLLYAEICHFFQNSNLSSEKYITQTMNNRKRLSEYRDMEFQILYSEIMGNRANTIERSELQHELFPGNVDVLSSLIEVYHNNALFSKAHKLIIKLNKLIPDNPEFQLMLAKSYLNTNRLKKGMRYVERRIEENPKNTDFLIRKGQFHLHMEEWDEAEDAFQNAIFVSPENKEMWLSMIEHINFARNNNIKKIDLEKFVGNYRLESGELDIDNSILNGYLYCKADNQIGSFYYPTSDTSFLGDFGFYRTSFYINDYGSVYKQSDIQSNITNPVSYWRQDSIIKNAEKMLESEKHEEALAAFEKAYVLHPEHDYLANYIKHLDFILSENYDIESPIWDSYLGTYGNSDNEIFKEKGKYFARTSFDIIKLILPISINQFMFPGIYNLTVEFIEENGQISHIQVSSNDSIKLNLNAL